MLLTMAAAAAMPALESRLACLPAARRTGLLAACSCFLEPRARRVAPVQFLLRTGSGLSAGVQQVAPTGPALLLYPRVAPLPALPAGMYGG